MLKSLGVSRSGYRAFLNRKVSLTRQRKSAIKKRIQHIYDDSNQNYGAPKITKELRKSGECISQRTVGKYMREMGIKAQWINLGLQPPAILISAKSCITSLMSSLIQTVLMLHGVQILPTFGLLMVLYTLIALWTYIPVKSLPGHLPIHSKYPQ